MKKSLLIIAATGITALAGCSSSKQPTEVTWQVLQNNGDNYTHRITVKGPMDFEKLGFNCFARKMTPLNPLDTITEIVPGYYTLTSARFGQGQDTVNIDIATPRQFSYCAYSLDGFHRIEPDGSTSPVMFTRLPITEKEQWTSPDGIDHMPYGNAIFDRNQEIYTESAPGAYDVIPSYKSVTLTGGESKTPLAFAWTKTENPNPEYYTITVRNDSMIVGANDERQAQIAKYSFDQLVAKRNAALPNAEIVDYPDMPYRALMIDISRNYQSPAAMKHFVDLMAERRLNTLHLHLLDDEAWRLEIKQLPELTQLGARRGYTTDESEYLCQIFSGDGNPDTPGTNNGYYSREDYIDFIKYAYDRGINVIPEIESPGHARAAVKAMEKRYRDTGDATYRLIEDGDTSSYTSAQSFHDNVMNPALEGPYKFMETVIGEIQSMYADAGVPLKAIHIGGDEVARGAWDGSPSAQKFMADNNIPDQTALHGYFVNRVMNIMREKCIKVSGWQEIALGHDDKYNREVSPQVYSVNCWHTSTNNSSVPVASVNNGFNTILSNVERFYLDMMYNPHPEEKGLCWGGFVDEFTSLNGYPAVLCPVDETKKDKIFGISGQLFSETIRNPEMVEYFLLPKMLGLTERAWNNDTTYTDQQFNAIIGTKEIPQWAADNINFHLRQPGVKVMDGKAWMNSPYPGAEIRYTLDGSEPTPASTLYTQPIAVDENADIRARLYFNGASSLTTYSKR